MPRKLQFFISIRNNYRANKTHVSATRTEPLYYMLIKWGGGRSLSSMETKTLIFLNFFQRAAPF